MLNLITNTNRYKPAKTSTLESQASPGRFCTASSFASVAEVTARCCYFRCGVNLNGHVSLRSEPDSTSDPSATCNASKLESIQVFKTLERFDFRQEF
jgi:hypothetical protein